MYPHFFVMGLYSEDLRVLKKAAKYLFPFCMWEDFSRRDNRFVQSKWKGWEQTFNSPSSGMSTSPGGLYRDPNLHSFSHVPGPRCLLPTHCVWLRLEALLHCWALLQQFRWPCWEEKSRSWGVMWAALFSSAVLSAEIYDSKFTMQISFTILNCQVLLGWCRGNWICLLTDRLPSIKRLQLVAVAMVSYFL